ncbi:NmrA-like family protein [Xylariales sp. PMI_506]|nr:NmrA-like family protein [Xylariales sp. PMI_506]
MSSTRLIAVVGATGAQGIPIVRALAQAGNYTVRFLTRDPNSARSRELQSFGRVEPLAGSFASEANLRSLFRGAWGAFVNIDGFNSGEKTEMFWAIRAYELALEEGVQMFVYGNLDFVYKKGGYDPALRTGHYDGKGRIGEWILQQNRDNKHRMKAALFTTGPYIEMSIAARAAMTPKVKDGVLTWRLPLAQGAVVHVALEDCGHYVRWLFEHPERASGMDLEVAIAHITYDEMAEAFTRVTGKPARFVDTGFDEFFAGWLGSTAADRPAGYNASPDDPATMSLRQNFTGFWTMWQRSGGNAGVVRRNYALLDEIHPNRIRSAEDWFRREDQRGRELGLGGLWERVQDENMNPILKNTEPGRLSSI